MKKNMIPVILCLALGSITAGRSQDLVKSDGLSGSLHKAHLGEITFMAKPLPLADLGEKDLLKTFELREEGDLNIRVFMANSLINYLHRMAPGLSVEELGAAGNFQFTFIVDGTVTYTENLPPGAGGIKGKIAQTTYRVPLMSTTEEDSWGRFLWGRFLINGGEDAFSAGRHGLKIEIRPYIKAPDLKIGVMIASGRIDLNVVKPAVDETLTAPLPILPGSGWPVSADPYDRDKIRDLKRKIAQRDFKDITSLIVIKDGKLLIEEYFNGVDRTSLHNTRSVGKSFASALMGLAVRDGLIKDIGLTLGELYDLRSFAHYSSKKSSVALRDLLTMSSAFCGSDQDMDSPGNEEKMYPTADWVKFALDLPMDETKENGKQWDYFTAGVVLLGDILDKAVPGGLEQYADLELFKPMGITKYEWQYTPQKVVNTAGGLAMTALDLAKFGQLYKNGGFWDGRSILPKSWVEATFQKYLQVPTRADTSYGLLFWNTAYQANGRSFEAFFATGNGGSKIYIFTDQPLVVVVTATAYGKPYGHAQVDKMMERCVLPAVVR